MKTTSTVLAALFALAGSALADPFSVAFLCTIESEVARTMGADGSFQVATDIAGLPIGSQFRGMYSYDAPVADGTFYLRPSPSAGGQIDLPSQLYAPVTLAILDMGGWLTVTDGFVSNFIFCPCRGPFDANFFFGVFSIGNHELDTGARGSISWEAPVGRGLTPVPEGGSTLVLVGVALALLGAGRRVVVR